ncbi:MAG: PAS domain S-box protein [Steroidobacteraceae bacterium]
MRDTRVLTSFETMQLLAPSFASYQAAQPLNPLSIEELQRATFVQFPLGISYAMRDGTFVWCNTAFDEMLGLAPGEHQHKSIHELTQDADDEQADELLESLWNGKIASYAVEKHYRKRDGQYLWVRVTAALIRNGNGEPVCSVGFVEDISSRKEAELALEQNRRMIEAVAENVPVALIASDQSGRITFSNRAATELHAVGTDSPDGDATGLYREGSQLHLADGKTPLLPDQRPLDRALRGEVLTNFEFVLTPRDAKSRVLLANACPLTGPGHHRLGAVAVLQDITHLRETEAEVSRIHRDLVDASRQAGMAEVATNVLHNVGNVLNSVTVSASLVANKIRRSKGVRLNEVATLLNESKDRLTLFLADDERGRQLPLYLAKLATQLEAEREDWLKELAGLRSNLDHIQQAVSMQQAHAKRCAVPQDICLSDILEESLRINAEALSTGRVKIKRDFRDAPNMSVDKHKVLQILVNLVRNAKLACDEALGGRKLITLRVQTLEQTVKISVADNGVGISSETMRRLFNHGFTTRKDGHGFGLHSAALTAKELNGTLSAHSAGLGFGATFTLELPLTTKEHAGG